jgi:magnesium-transporting ATPase (P-type)
MINGEEKEMTQELRDEIQQANTDFAALGERVLGFAKIKLPINKYHKNYQFDIKMRLLLQSRPLTASRLMSLQRMKFSSDD